MPVTQAQVLGLLVTLGYTPPEMSPAEADAALAEFRAAQRRLPVYAALSAGLPESEGDPDWRTVSMHPMFLHRSGPEAAPDPRCSVWTVARLSYRLEDETGALCVWFRRRGGGHGLPWWSEPGTVSTCLWDEARMRWVRIPTEDERTRS